MFGRFASGGLAFASLGRRAEARQLSVLSRESRTAESFEEEEGFYVGTARRAGHRMIDDKTILKLIAEKFLKLFLNGVFLSIGKLNATYLDFEVAFGRDVAVDRFLAFLSILSLFFSKDVV